MRSPSPLWKEQPLLLNQMIAGGLDARIVKVDLGGLVGMEYINKVRLPIPLSVSIYMCFSVLGCLGDTMETNCDFSHGSPLCSRIT